MTEDEWVHFVRTGKPLIASVGRLDNDLCAHLDAATDLVRVRHDYTLKMLHKHRVEPHHLPLIESCLAFGRAVADKKHHITFFYCDEIVFGGWYQLTIKAADYGTELWVATFHPQSVAEVIRRTKKYRLLRAGTE